MQMAFGTVKKYFGDRRFGFILRDDGAEDIFVHGNQLENADALSTGEKVSFQIEPNPRTGRLNAVNVHVVT